MLACKIEAHKGRQTATPHQPKDQKVTIKGLKTKRGTESQKEIYEYNSIIMFLTSIKRNALQGANKPITYCFNKFFLNKTGIIRSKRNEVNKLRS